MKLLLCALLLAYCASCNSHTEKARFDESRTKPDSLAVVDATNNASRSSSRASGVNGMAPEQTGAVVIDSKVLATENLAYTCRVTIVNLGYKAIRGVELVDYHDAGGLKTMYNLRRSVQPLRKIKLTIAANGKATTTFAVESSRTKPEISKVFYQDGTVQHTYLDIVGDQAYPEEVKPARGLKPERKRSHMPKDQVSRYYDENRAALGDAALPFHQTDIK